MKLYFATLSISMKKQLRPWSSVGCRRKLDNLDFGGLRARVSARGDSLRNFCDRSHRRASGAPARSSGMHACRACTGVRRRACAHTHVHTCRDDELDRVIVPLATGVVGTIKACVPGVKTCKDALYKVPARRHRSVALFSLPQSLRNETFKYPRTSFPTAAPHTRFSAPFFRPASTVLAG